VGLSHGMHVERPDPRRGTAADRAWIVESCTRAFRADPIVRWLFPDDIRWPQRAALFFGFLFDIRLAGGLVEVTSDRAAAALWTPPGGNRRGPDWVSARWAEVAQRLEAAELTRMDLFEALMTGAHPAEPHWYLGVLVTRPDAQGGGRASALLARGLARADADLVPAALETGTSANVAFYRRRGFEVRTRRALPGGPDVWLVERQPGGPHLSPSRTAPA
jgi:GNAT superfamily N-acetyltransferase